MIVDCTALIMAGGESQRMGRDKVTMVLGEQTLLQHVVSVVQPLFLKVLVSVRQPHPEIELPQICDSYPDAGPLAGLCAGLEQAGTSWIFAVATDMPFVQPALIERLAQRRAGFQAVVPMVNGYPQPLAAFYSASCLAVIQGILSGSGKRSMRAALEQLNVCYVDASELLAVDPGLSSFFDLDTPEDFTVAHEKLIASSKEYPRG